MHAPDFTPAPLELLRRAHLLHERTMRCHRESLDRPPEALPRQDAPLVRLKRQALALRTLADAQDPTLPWVVALQAHLTSTLHAITAALARRSGPSPCTPLRGHERTTRWP